MNVLIGYNLFTLPKYMERLKTILRIYRIWLFYFILFWGFDLRQFNKSLQFTSWARLVRHAHKNKLNSNEEFKNEFNNYH